MPDYFHIAGLEQFHEEPVLYQIFILKRIKMISYHIISYRRP